MSLSIRTLSKNELPLLKPLREKLNEIHLHDSPHFKNFYESFTFEKRIVSFDTIMPDNMLIQKMNYTGTSSELSGGTETRSGEYSKISPGWHFKYLQISFRVEKRMALTLPVFKLDIFARLIPTLSAISLTCIFLSARTLSSRKIIAIYHLPFYPIFYSVSSYSLWRYAPYSKT